MLETACFFTVLLVVFQTRIHLALVEYFYSPYTINLQTKIITALSTTKTYNSNDKFFTVH